MRLFLSLSVAAVLSVLVLTACNSKDHSSTTTTNANNSVATTQPTTTTPGDSVPRITTVELKNAMDKGEAVVIDVRSPSAYEQGHIKGSLSIPTADLLAKVDQLPRDKKIITYCS